jgi:hypothetical protein
LNGHDGGDGIAVLSQKIEVIHKHSHEYWMKCLLNKRLCYSISTVSDASHPAATFTPLTSSDAQDAALMEQLKQKLQFAELKIQLLEERLRQMLINNHRSIQRVAQFILMARTTQKHHATS